jgi:hypothetical protein
MLNLLWLIGLTLALSGTQHAPRSGNLLLFANAIFFLRDAAHFRFLRFNV